MTYAWEEEVAQYIKGVNCSVRLEKHNPTYNSGGHDSFGELIAIEACMLIKPRFFTPFRMTGKVAQYIKGVNCSVGLEKHNPTYNSGGHDFLGGLFAIEACVLIKPRFFTPFRITGKVAQYAKGEKTFQLSTG